MRGHGWRGLRVIVVVAVVVAAAAGCTSSPSVRTDVVPPPASAGASADVATSAAVPSTVSVPPASAEVPEPTAAPTAVDATTTVAPPLADCGQAPLSMSVPPFRRVVATAAQTGLTNIVALDVTVANLGATTCTTNGWPVVTFRGDACRTVGLPCDPAQDIPTDVVHADGAPTDLQIPPGGTTTFSLAWSGGTLCGSAPAAIDVALPGQTAPVRLAPVDICSAGDDGSPLEVTPLGTLEQWRPGS